MKPIALLLALAVAPVILAQSPALSPAVAGGEDLGKPPKLAQSLQEEGFQYPTRPFTRYAVGGAISTLGIDLQAATYLSPHLNLRGEGHVFTYNRSGLIADGLNIEGTLHMASASALLDYYPFQRWGLRLTPGLLLYNSDSLTANVTVAAGQTFTLSGTTYTVASEGPVMGHGSVGLHGIRPGMVLTTGWGNMIPRKAGHWTFPFELGVAITGAPSVGLALTSGEACVTLDSSCVNVATDPTIAANLASQISAYKEDLKRLDVYPVVSFGAAYSFSFR